MSPLSINLISVPCYQAKSDWPQFPCRHCDLETGCQESVSPSTSARLAVRSGSPAGSSMAWSTGSVPMARSSASIKTLTTPPSTPRLATGSSCPGLSLWTSNPPSLTRSVVHLKLYNSLHFKMNLSVLLSKCLINDQT